jgi:hypothetical protein
MARLPVDARVALLAFAIVILIMGVVGWIGYDHWWTERYY